MSDFPTPEENRLFVYTPVRRVRILRRWRPFEWQALRVTWSTPQRYPEQQTTYAKARFGWWIETDMLQRVAPKREV